MSFKIQGTMSPPTFRMRKIGDLEKMVGRIVFEFRIDRNRGINVNDLLDQANEASCSITIEELGQAQMDFFNRRDAEIELANLEEEEATQKNKEAMKMIKDLKEEDAKEKLPATKFRSRVNAIKRVVHPPEPAKEDTSKKSSERQRLDDLAFSEDVNRISEAKKAIAKIENEDKKKKLTDKQLKTRLDKVDKIIMKHNSNQSQTSMMAS